MKYLLLYFLLFNFYFCQDIYTDYLIENEDYYQAEIISVNKKNQG